MSILSLNVQGIYTSNKEGKLGLLKDIAFETNAMVIALTESHLLQDIKDSEIKIEGYDPYRSDRLHGEKGGILVYIKSSLGLGVTEIDKGSINHVEYSVIEMKKIETVLITVYRPPGAELSAFSSVLLKIKESFKKFEKMPLIIWSGDFNFPNIDWKVSDVKGGTVSLQQQAWALMKILDEYQLEQCVFEPTRGRNILDLYVTNNVDHILKIEVDDISISDHRIVNIITRISTRPQSGQWNREENDLSILNFTDKNIDWEALKEAINHYEIENRCQNKNAAETYSYIIESLSKACQGHVPARKNPSMRKIPRDRRILMRKRCKLNNQIRDSTNIDRKKLLKDKVIEIEGALKDSHQKEAERAETRAIGEIKNNYKYFFQFAKDKSNVKTLVGPFIENNRVLETPKDKAAKLMEHFTSVYSETACCDRSLANIFLMPGISGLDDIDITKEDIIKSINETSSSASPGPDGVSIILLQKCSSILAGPLMLLWKKSLREGTVPENLKFGLVTAIFKSGDRFDPKNYRPITMSSHISKVFERVLIKALTLYLDKLGIFNEGQHGFRSGRSTTSQLLEHIQKIIQILEEDLTADVIYLDFAKAFDKVDHETILRKLRSIGISGNLLKWLGSFLVGRRQAVAVEGYIGERKIVNSGVPQGSVLGPLLFLIHIADIDYLLTEATASSFADDTRIMMQITSERDVHELQRELDKIFLWAEANKMAFNSKKFEHLRYNPNKDMKNIFYGGYVAANDSPIEMVNHTKDLGIIMSNSACFTDQVEEVVKKGKKMSGWILRTFKTRAQLPMMTLFKSLVLPVMEYCCVAWSPGLLGQVRKLESVQRYFTSKIRSISHLNYWERLKHLELYSLERRRERYAIIYTMKILKELVPNFSNESYKIKTYVSQRRGLLCSIPVIRVGSSDHHKALKDGSFAVMGPRLFNCIPKTLRDKSLSINSFKAQLDIWLKGVPDKPKLQDYNTQNFDSNSIVVQSRRF